MRKLKTNIYFLLISLIALIFLGAYHTACSSYSAHADGTDDKIEFFPQSDDTVFSPIEGCPYKIKLPQETAGLRLYLEDYNFHTEEPILIATTFEEDIEEITPEANAMPIEPVELQIEQGPPGEPVSEYKYALVTFMRNGSYTAKAYSEGANEPFAEESFYFQGIDFAAPFIGKIYGDGWQIYDDFYFEGMAIILEYTVDDTKTDIKPSAQSGVKSIRIYFSKEYDEETTTIGDLELLEQVDLGSSSVVQKYSSTFKVDKVGFYFFETEDWVGNTSLYPPFEYSERNTELYTYLAHVERMLTWEGYTNNLKSDLQDAYDYYRSLSTDPSAQEEDVEQAWQLLVEERNRFENAKVTTIVNVQGEKIDGLTAYLNASAYPTALKGDTLTLNITVESLPKDYNDYAVLQQLQDASFDKAIKFSISLLLNNQPVTPNEPIEISVPIGAGYSCVGVVGYNQYYQSGYTALRVNEGDSWIAFDHIGTDKGYVLLLANDNAKDTQWILWTIIGIGFGAVIALAVFLSYKYKKEKKLSTEPSVIIKDIDN